MKGYILDYHNNDLVADLHDFINNPELNLTDWEYLCAVAKIVDKRKVPTFEMRDCQTGIAYQDRGKEMFEQALSIARRNAGQ